MGVTGDHCVGEEKEVFQDGGRYWVLFRGQEREEQTSIWLLDLIRWTSLITLTIVISVTVEREKNPDWNTLRKENEVRKWKQNRIVNVEECGFSGRRYWRRCVCQGHIHWGKNCCCWTEKGMSSLRKWEDRRARAQ